MKIVDQNIKIIDDINGIDMLKKLEKIGRVAYKSEDKVTDDSYIDFIKKIIINNHLAVIEHVSKSVHIITDRAIANELVRHRIASYTQECVAGDTKIRKNLTIKQLFDRQNRNSYDKTHNKTISLRSVNENGFIINNKHVNVFYTGKKEVYEVETHLGYKIKCTMNHRFLNDKKEYICLSNLNIGDSIMTNGRKCLVKILDKELVELYNNLSPQEISCKLGIPYRSVVLKLKKIGNFVSRKNDKDKSKYNKNHTKDSYLKMKIKILDQFRNGRHVWNKGLKYGEDSRITNTIDSLKKYNHEHGYVGGGSNYKNGISTYKNLKNDIICCELCNNKNNLEVHHIDSNRQNNVKENLIKVCCRCHQLLHHGFHVATKTVIDKIKSINYIGFEDTYDIEMASPYNNYIANGFVVHNSTRFCNYNKDKFNNEIVFIDQGLDGDCYDIWINCLIDSENKYMSLIRYGIKPQIARSVLPLCLKTEIVATMNLRQWLHFFKLRTAPNAHPLMIELAKIILFRFKKEIPIIFDEVL